MEVKWHEKGLGGQDPIMWKGEEVAGEERVDSLDGEEFQGRWLRQGTWREQELGDDRSFFTWDLLSDLGHKTLPWALRCQSAAKLKIFYHRLKIVDQLKVLAELWRKEKIEHSLWISSHLVWRRNVRNHVSLIGRTDPAPRPSCGTRPTMPFWTVWSINLLVFQLENCKATHPSHPCPSILRLKFVTCTVERNRGSLRLENSFWLGWREWIEWE